MAAVAAAALSACAPSQKQEVAPQNNPEMGIIDNGDSLVVTDVAPESAAQIQADTVN